MQYQAQLAQDQRDVKRAEDLVQRKLVSEQAVEQARTLVETQGAPVGKPAQADRAGGGQCALRTGATRLLHRRAPFTGVVIAKAAQVGEIVSPFSAGGGFTRTGIGTLVDMDSLEIEVDVNEAYINRVQPEAAGGFGVECVPGLEDSVARDCYHPHCRPLQGDREGAHRTRSEGRPHRP